MYYTTQHYWTWWLALYLFLGGMGAASVAISCLTDMYLKPHPQLVLWGNLSGFMMLNIGSSMLFLHLLHHLAVINVLVPTVLLNKPDAWIAWGTQFIVWMMLLSLLYALPYMRASAFFQKLPIVNKILECKLIAWLDAQITKVQRIIGWLATLSSIGTVIYTGLLLQSFPAVALWNNPGVPILFSISAFSTALAFLLLALYLAIKDDQDHQLIALFERADLILVGLEIVVIFVFFQYTTTSSESARHSAHLLWNDNGWLIGFLTLGLIVPFLLELKGVIHGWKGHAPIIIAALLVLNGGYLLRYYFMNAGVYGMPYPPHAYSVYRAPEQGINQMTIIIPEENPQVINGTSDDLVN